LAFVLLVSIALSWLAVKLERARSQRQAVEAIVQSGGVVWYDYQLNDRGQYYVSRPKPPFPTWMRQLLGDDFFFDVLNVDAGDFTDKTMTHLAQLSRLKRLGLTDTQVTDAGLAHLEGLTNLEWLSLSGTQVSDAGMERLRGLGHLRSLDLDYTQITDAGLAHLEGLTSLQQLQLIDTRVTDDGLEHLEGLVNLKELYLWHTQVTSEGAKKLREALPECRIEHWN
jgi:hypothetical protein